MKPRSRFNKRLRRVVFSLFFVVCTAHSEVVVVVAKDSPIDTLSKRQIANIFLGKAHSFPDGTPAIPFNQKEGSAARDKFYVIVSGKTPAQVKAHWSKMIFTGRGQPPKELHDDIALKQLIASNTQNIGYIEHDKIDDSLKKIRLK